eukprot:m.31346 g.31346  ORF g.31346 m.31346 type:complete len:102 (+) comp9303_c1_seq1:2187-2492(+)
MNFSLSLLFLLSLLACVLGMDHGGIAVKLNPNADPNQVAAAHGLENLGQIGSLEHHYLFRHPDRSLPLDAVREHAARLAKHEAVLWQEVQLPKRRSRRDLL